MFFEDKRREFCENRFMIRFLLFAVLGLGSVAARAELVSTAVGLIREQVITSREVQIDRSLEAALPDGGSAAGPVTLDPHLKNLDSKAFAQAVKDTLLEAVVAREARSFNVMQVSPDEVQQAETRAQRALKNVSDWKRLRVSAKELDTAIRRKLQARKFIRFRAESSVLPVTDVEAERYFSENRLKFGDLPFEKFKENIKSYLSKTQVDKRLKDWYEVLLGKYQVKNLISEM